MYAVKELTYKEYKIEIHPQPKTGDNTKSFFGIWKNNKKIFSVWEEISRTESRSINKGVVFNKLEEKGINRIKQMIDNENFESGKEYRFWESAD